MEKAELVVRGETLERVYINYKEGRFRVNRRYQRKLIWSIEEKQNFIDSLIRNYPVPLVLLAEVKIGSGRIFEIIDGMQRINAIVSFFENEFPVQGRYFDLQTMAVTKERLDSGSIEQKGAPDHRIRSTDLVSYQLPLSIFSAATSGDVDTVFRRINSGGQKLSVQDLRAAGSLTPFAAAVRKASATIRGDATLEEVLPLENMKLISIASGNFNYGIRPENTMWVKHGILNREQLRASVDEEVVAYVLSYCVSPKPIAARGENLDSYFTDPDHELQRNVQEFGIDHAVEIFSEISDDFSKIFNGIQSNFRDTIFDEPYANPIPRYFQLFLISLFLLRVRDNKRLDEAKIPKLLQKLRGMAKHILMPPGGGWTVEARKKEVERVKRAMAPFFVKNSTSPPLSVNHLQKFENLLIQSKVENNIFDLKQGFLKLSKNPEFDESSFEKILKTLVSFSNRGPGCVGYVIVGVADNEADAGRVKELFNVKPYQAHGRWVTGIDHEIPTLGKGLDQAQRALLQKIRSSKLSEELKDHILQNVSIVNYRDKSVWIAEAKGGKSMATYNGKAYIREDSNVIELKDASRIVALSDKFR